MQGILGKVKLIWLCCLVVLLSSGCSGDDMQPVSGENIKDMEEVYRLSDADRKVEGIDAKSIQFAEGADVYWIDEPGDYLLEGKQKGQICIDVEDELVHLTLKNAELESINGPAIYVKTAGKVVITIPKGTKSSVMDSAYYEGEEDAKACIYSTCDLTINGDGDLTVCGYYKDAVRTKDVLKLLGIHLMIQAKETGIRGNDGVVIQTPVLDVQCEGDGIYTEKQNKENKGFVDIKGAKMTIIAGGYGINASENIYLRECDAKIVGVIQDVNCQGKLYAQENRIVTED